VTDYRSMYDKQFIGSWDLPDDRDAVVTITRVEAGKVSNGTKSDRKPLVYVTGRDGKELPKPIVLNATNGKTIASLYTAKVESWLGKKIALYKTTVQGVGGGVVDAIRIRPTVPDSSGGEP
jgi:hypothetical protein